MTIIKSNIKFKKNGIQHDKNNRLLLSLKKYQVEKIWLQASLFSSLFSHLGHFIHSQGFTYLYADSAQI